jgi:hypothetical protein
VGDGLQRGRVSPSSNVGLLLFAVVFLCSAGSSLCYAAECPLLEDCSCIGIEFRKLQDTHGHCSVSTD